MSYLSNFQDYQPLLIPKKEEDIKLYYNKIIFNPNEIMYLESDINYTIFHLSDGKQHISSFTLKYHTDKLKNYSNFCRINRSVCINTDYIAQRSEGEIVLANGKTFIISRRRQKVITDKLGNQHDSDESKAILCHHSNPA